MKFLPLDILYAVPVLDLYWPTSVKQVQLDNVDGDGVDEDVVAVAVTPNVSSGPVHGLHN